MPDLLDPNQIAADFLSNHLDAVLDYGKDLLKGAREELRLRLGSTYRKYIEHLLARHGTTKSFLLRDQAVPLYDFYVPLDLLRNRNRRDSQFPGNVKALLARGPAHIITGSAGCGKSMLIKHLLLDCLRSKLRVPIFIELRQFNEQDTPAPLISLLKRALSQNQFDLGDAYVDKALRAGHFLVFLDGYDEVAPKRRLEVTAAIIEFSKTFERNGLVITSRPDPTLEGWQSFSLSRVAPLTKTQAASLVEKLRFDEQLTQRFLSDLRSRLFDQHESFLSNPLLLSIMLLSYTQSASIPTKVSVFYNQAYEALFERHDTLKPGFHRQRRTLLDIQDFARLFAGFSLLSYDRRKLEFTATEALEYIEAAQDLAGVSCTKRDYLDDLIEAVSLMVQDGLQIVYAHRSFQEYFAARFICEAQPHVQGELLRRYTSDPHFYTDSVLGLLSEMRPELVETQYLLPGLKAFFRRINARDTIGAVEHEAFLRLCFDEFLLSEDGVIGALPLRSKTAIGTLNLVVFALQRFGGLIGYQLPKSNQAERTLAHRYLPDSANGRLSLTKSPQSAAFIRSLSDVPGSLFSLEALRSLRGIQDTLTEKLRRGESSITRMLKSR